MFRRSTRPLSFAIILAAALLAGCDPHASRGDHDATHADAIAEPSGVDVAHGHAIAQAAGVDVPIPPGHEPWAPDAPLVEGMSRVRSALAALGHGADAATVAAAVADVDAAVEYMFAHCRLPTEPDVALHAILARLMAGSEAMKADPANHAAVADMQGAVRNYERLFDDPAG